MDARTEQRRRLNDLCRTDRTGVSGMWVQTPGVSALPVEVQTLVHMAVTLYERWEEGNDPYGEHDFGVVTVPYLQAPAAWHGKVTCYWKIDVYDRALEYGSPDAADASVSQRVLTIMLQEES